MTDQDPDDQSKADDQPEHPPAQDQSPPESHTRPPLPEPSLKTFVSAMAGQVLINLGLFENPASSRRDKNLEQAKYTIDLLQILRDKMKGNLDDEEQKLFDTALYDLRMRYIEACR